MEREGCVWRKNARSGEGVVELLYVGRRSAMTTRPKNIVFHLTRAFLRRRRRRGSPRDYLQVLAIIAGTAVLSMGKKVGATSHYSSELPVCIIRSLNTKMRPRSIAENKNKKEIRLVRLIRFGSYFHPPGTCHGRYHRGRPKATPRGNETE